jgi:hypothetical protein
MSELIEMAHDPSEPCATEPCEACQHRLDRTQSVVDINCALARAVGLDPEDGLVAFTIDVEKDRYPLVTATHRHRGEVVTADTTTYRLVPVEDDEIPA